MHASLIVAALVWIFVGAAFVFFIYGSNSANKRDRDE